MNGFSVKPGRGPSAFGAVGGAIGAAFGILWTILAVYLTADAPFPAVRIIFPLFGVVFVVASIAGAIFNAHNATARGRFSAFDVVPTGSEPEPPIGDAAASRFCTACGAGLRADDHFCGKCGRPATH